MPVEDIMDIGFNVQDVALEESLCNIINDCAPISNLPSYGENGGGSDGSKKEALNPDSHLAHVAVVPSLCKPPTCINGRNNEKYKDDYDGENENDGKRNDEIRQMQRRVEEEGNHRAQSRPLQCYESRKPKWWIKLSGRRGTPAQRKATRRMTDRGYCISLKVHMQRGSGEGVVGEKKLRMLRWKALLSAGSCSPNSGSPSSKIDSDLKKEYGGVWIEIGFGNGDNLLANAIQRPNRLFLGSEIHQPGVGTVLMKIEKTINAHISSGAELLGTSGAEESVAKGVAHVANTGNDGKTAEMTGDHTVTTTECEAQINEYDDKGFDSRKQNESNGSFISRSCSEQHKKRTHQSSSPPHFSGVLPYGNVRIIPGDGIKFLRTLPSNSLSAVLITFPDPWPKENQVHWRVVQEDTLCDMARVLTKPSYEDEEESGKVLIATDAECFDSWSREVFTKTSLSQTPKEIGANGDCGEIFSWKEVIPCPDRSEWLPTVSYYERKGLEEGRKTMLQCWRIVRK